MSGMDGWARAGAGLGEAMSGGVGGAYGQSHDAAMSRGHVLQKKLAEAKIASDKMRQREQADIQISEMAAANPELAPMIKLAGAMSMGGVGNFDQNTRGGMNLTRHENLLAARDAAASGDTATAAMLAGLSNQTAKIPEQTKITGNTMFNPTLGPDQQAQVSPYGSGVLANRAASDAGRNDAAMLRAMSSGGSRGKTSNPSSPAAWDGTGASPQAQGEYEKMLKQIAQEVYNDAKLAGGKLTGIGVKQVEHALRTTGEFRDLDGKVHGTTDIKPTHFMGYFDNVTSSAERVPKPLQNTPTSAMTSPEPVTPRTMTGAPVTETKPNRQQNAAATAQVAMSGKAPAQTYLPVSEQQFRPLGAPLPGAVARPANKAEYDALPSGTRFTAPDGTTRIKP